MLNRINELSIGAKEATYTCPFSWESLIFTARILCEQGLCNSTVSVRLSVPSWAHSSNNTGVNVGSAMLSAYVLAELRLASRERIRLAGEQLVNCWSMEGIVFFKKITEEKSASYVCHRPSSSIGLAQSHSSECDSDRPWTTLSTLAH